MPRGSTPPLSSLIANASDVEGDLDRALTDLTAAEPKQLTPADDEDAEMVVEPREAEPVAAAAPVPAKRATVLSEPEISIEDLEDEAEADHAAAARQVIEQLDFEAQGEDSGRVVAEVLKDTSSQKITMTTDHSEPEIVVEPMVAAESGPHHPRPKRQTDAPD
jgi:hypothetical protein